MLHKFNVGQTVQIKLSGGYPEITARGLYEVTRTLPERNGEFEYRVKSLNEPHERTAKEGELIGTDRRTVSSQVR
jgi:hypothetical protein